MDKDIFFSLPCIVNTNGVRGIMIQQLDDDEKEKLFVSAKKMEELLQSIEWWSGEKMIAFRRISLFIECTETWWMFYIRWFDFLEWKNKIQLASAYSLLLITREVREMLFHSECIAESLTWTVWQTPRLHLSLAHAVSLFCFAKVTYFVLIIRLLYLQTRWCNREVQEHICSTFDSNH